MALTVDEKNINIAFYTINLYNNGVFKIMSTLSQYLPKKYSIHIFVSDSHEKDFIPSYKLGGQIHYFNIPLPRKKNIFTKLKKNYLRKKILKQHKLANNIDLTLTFSENANIHNIITKGNGKSIISVHSYMSRTIVDGIKYKFYTFFYKFMIKKYFNKANSIIAVSNGVKHDLVDNFKINSDLTNVLYNPHNIDQIIRFSKENLDPKFNILFDESFTIINIARICHAKGHWNLIRAFSLVKKQIPNAKLMIIGDSDIEIKLLIQKLISDLSLDENVFLLGYQDNPYKFLSKSDIFAFSSISEGFGISIVEALACSIPVVSTDCKSGPREILAPSTDYSKSTDNIEYCDYGILTPPSKQGFLDATIPITSEEKLFAQAILELSRDKAIYNTYAKKGLKRAYDFGLDRTIDKYDKLIMKELNS